MPEKKVKIVKIAAGEMVYCSDGTGFHANKGPKGLKVGDTVQVRTRWHFVTRVRRVRSSMK